MSELVTCSHCGATNPPDAEWCGQCFGSLGSRPSESPEPEAPGHESSAADPPATGQGPVRSGWECRACQSVNDVDTSECSVCGLSIYDSYGAGSDQAAFDPETALRRSIIFPGFGYGSLGFGGIGVVAGFLSIAAMMVGGMLVIAGELIGIILIVAAVAIWVISIVDVVRLAQGEPVPLLRPRVLSIVGGFVFILLMATVMLAFQSATS